MSIHDIFNRPPTIAEDTLRYTIHPPENQSDKSSVTALATYILQYVDNLLPDFLWHRDTFRLEAAFNPDTGSLVLEGTMRVGDAVDDEWCAVWLLREISAKWDVVISVYDSDGDFLLIEAAEALPPWVTPSNSENRVWIYNSHLHLISLSHISLSSRKRNPRKLPGLRDSDDEDGIVQTDEDSFIAVPDALILVRDSSGSTVASRAVETIVWDRISGYPSAALNHIHYTKAYLPVDIVRALSTEPALIQKAVETFYTRDAIQLKSAQRMSRFPPSNSVISTVKVTRPAYAQLMGQKFYPPKVFGTWKESMDSKEWKWKDIGMKIAVGFEMLFQESKSKAAKFNSTPDGIQSNNDARKDALRRTPEYVAFIKKLTSIGYFHGQLEGSNLWNELEDKASASFVEFQRVDDATRTSFASLVGSAISRASETPMLGREEDDDSWLNIDSDSFEDMLKNATLNASNASSSINMNTEQDNGASQEDKIVSEQASKLKDLASKVEQFVEGDGDLEGARFDDDMLSDEEFSDDSMSADEPEEPETPDKYAARQEAMDKLVPSLKANEYGVMPASYHSNSQKVAAGTSDIDQIEEKEETRKQTENRSKTMRQPILPRDRYDGVDSDDETDEEEDVDSEDEEDKPQVVGDIDIDMGEEEEEFLEFSRQALGISDDQWNDILQERRDRGAFVPSHASPSTKKKNVDALKAPETSSIGQSVKNTNLDSFETVMKAMDAELARIKSQTSKPQPPTSTYTDKGKGKAVEEDIEAAMDAELQDGLAGDDDEDMEEEGMDYNLIKNFLESFKSQGGLSGPVSNLAGRLLPDLKFPRDEM